MSAITRSKKTKIPGGDGYETDDTDSLPILHLIEGRKKKLRVDGGPYFVSEIKVENAVEKKLEKKQRTTRASSKNKEAESGTGFNSKSLYGEPMTITQDNNPHTTSPHHGSKSIIKFVNIKKEKQEKNEKKEEKKCI